MNLNEYMQKNKPNKRKSKLDAIKDDIETLYNAEYSQKQILEYVTKHRKIKVSLTTLQHFIKTRFEKNTEIKPTPPINLNNEKPKNQEKKWGQKTYVVENQTRSKRLNLKELESRLN